MSTRTSLSIWVRLRMIHLTGICYVLGLIFIGWQTMLGHTILEWSTLTVAAGFSFLLSLAAGALMLRNADGLLRKLK